MTTPPFKDETNLRAIKLISGAIDVAITRKEGHYARIITYLPRPLDLDLDLDLDLPLILDLDMDLDLDLDLED